MGYAHWQADSIHCKEMFVGMFGNAFYSAVGQSTTFVDPGPQGNMCGRGLISDLKQTIEDQDPALLYIHVPFVSDTTRTVKAMRI